MTAFNDVSGLDLLRFGFLHIQMRTFWLTEISEVHFLLFFAPSLAAIRNQTPNRAILLNMLPSGEIAFMERGLPVSKL